MSIYIILGVVFAAGFVFAGYKLLKKEEITPVVNNTQEVVVKSVVEDIVKMNLQLRLKTNDTEVRAGFENLFDKVIKLDNLVNDPKNFSELTVIFNRMTEKYIPNLLNPFLKMEESEQLKNKAVLIESLNTLAEQLEKTEEAFNSADVAELNKMASFIDTMIGGVYNAN